MIILQSQCIHYFIHGKIKLLLSSIKPLSLKYFISSSLVHVFNWKTNISFANEIHSLSLFISSVSSDFIPDRKLYRRKENVLLQRNLPSFNNDVLTSELIYDVIT